MSGTSGAGRPVTTSAEPAAGDLNRALWLDHARACYAPDVSMLSLVASILLSNVEVPFVIDVGERKPTALILSRSAEFEPARNLSALLRLVQDTYRKESDLDPRLLEDARIEECVESRSFSSILFCEVMAALGRFEGRCRLLLYVLASGGESTSRVRVSYIALDDVRDDLEGTLLRLRGMPHPEARQRELDNLDARLEQAIRTGPDRSVASAADLARALKSSVRAELSAVIARMDAHRSSGVAEIVYEPRGAEVTLDGDVISAQAPGRIYVSGLKSGLHRVELDAEGYLSRNVPLEVPKEGDVSLSVRLSRHYRPERTGLFIAGAALSTAGLAFGALGLHARSNREPVAHARGLLRLVDIHDRGPSFDSTGGRGPLIVGLSAGLLVTGLTYSTLSLVSMKSDRSPWWDVLVGLGGGLAAYGVTEAVQASLD